MRPQHRLTVTVLLLCLSLVTIGCAAAPEREPAGSVSESAPSGMQAGEAWQPSSGFKALANDEAGAKAYWRAMHLKVDLQEALRHFLRIEGQFPESLDILLDRHPIFHQPESANPSGLSLEQLEADALPARGVIGIRIEPDAWHLITQWDPDPAKAPLDFEILLSEVSGVVTGDLTNTPLRDAAELRSAAAASWAQVPVGGDGNVAAEGARGANKFLFGSDRWEEARVRLLDVAIRTRLTTFVQVHGRCPANWTEVLAVTGEAPYGYSAKLTETTELAADEAAVLVAVRPSDLYVRLRLKPRVPAVDTVFLAYRLSQSGKGLERTTIVTPPSDETGFLPLVAAVLDPAL